MKNIIEKLRHKNQHLITSSLYHKLYTESLWEIDRQLAGMLLQQKMLGNSTHYIWRTQDDSKVRPSHTENDDKIFRWDSPPPTGHPGEDFNCRCWAEPIGDYRYADQVLITAIRDNPDQWTNVEFLNHYIFGEGTAVTLQETGLLTEIIEHFSETLGVYNDVNEQIIHSAINNSEGPVPYSFDNTYEFGDVWDLIINNPRFSLGDSTVKGVFDGGARIEKQNNREYLVINGIMTYNFSDKYRDLFSNVESLMEEEGISRDEAEERLGESTEIFGIPHDILDQWQTKFNATIDVTGR